MPYIPYRPRVWVVGHWEVCWVSGLSFGILKFVWNNKIRWVLRLYLRLLELVWNNMAHTMSSRLHILCLVSFLGHKSNLVSPHHYAPLHRSSEENIQLIRRHVGYQDFLWGSQSLFGTTSPIEEHHLIKSHASDTYSHGGVDEHKSMVLSLDWSKYLR